MYGGLRGVAPADEWWRRRRAIFKDYSLLYPFYKPKKYIKGTKMNFAGLKKVKDRADIVYFLRAQSDNPVPLP